MIQKYSKHETGDGPVNNMNEEHKLHNNSDTPKVLIHQSLT